MRRTTSWYLLLAFGLATSLAACDDPSSPPVQETTPPTLPTPSADDTPSPTSQPTTALATDLEDGRHAVFLHGVDVAARHVTVDVIQWLSGDEAAAAYQADNPGETEGPPNDYYVVNDNPRLRTLRVSTDVRVRLVRLHEDGQADLNPGTWDELTTYLQDYETNDERLSHNPFWLTLEGDVVVAIEEQYIP